MKGFFLFIFLFLNLLLVSRAQSYYVVKIHDTNLFELENNQKVRLVGVFIPSLNSKNIEESDLAIEILDWEKEFILDRKFNFKFISKSEDNVFYVMAFREYAFSEENLVKRFLSQGFAVLLSENTFPEIKELNVAQEKAKKDRIGIWDLDSSYLKEITSNVKTSLAYNDSEEMVLFQKSYERPYLPFLALSIASFALAIDAFASGKDLQSQIDFMKRIDKNYNTSELEASRTRKTVVGVAWIATGIITTLFSFKSIEVQPRLDGLSVSYRF